RRHLGDAVAEPVVHDRDEGRRDQQSPEPAGVQAEVPAVEVAGNDGGDTQRPQRPEGCVTAQPSPVEVVLGHVAIGDRPHLPLITQRATSLPRSQMWPYLALLLA